MKFSIRCHDGKRSRRVGCWLLATCVACLPLSTGCGQRGASVEPTADPALATKLREMIVSGAEAPTTGQAEAPKQEPTGWATLAGTFRLEGDPPQNAQLAVSGSDSEICAPGGKKVYAQDVRVGPDGGLRDVLIFLTTEIAGEEPWTHPSMAATATEEVIFDQKECLFLSHVAGVRVGQTLVVKNSDPIGHNTNIQTKDNPSFNQTIPAMGATKLKFQFEEKGPIPVSCSIHPWMRSNLIVCPNGYFAITDEAGRFSIPNLPAGVPLEFRVWHGVPGYLDGIPIGDQEVSKGRFTVTLAPGDTSFEDLQVTLNASNLE